MAFESPVFVANVFRSFLACAVEVSAGVFALDSGIVGATVETLANGVAALGIKVLLRDGWKEAAVAAPGKIRDAGFADNSSKEEEAGGWA